MILLGGTGLDQGRRVAINARNLGDRATTITNLYLEHYNSRLAAVLRQLRWARTFVTKEPSKAQRIPYRFEPGDIWLGMINQDADLELMLRTGYLYAVLHHSHNPKGVRCRLKLGARKADAADSSASKPA